MNIVANQEELLKSLRVKTDEARSLSEQLAKANERVEELEKSNRTCAVAIREIIAKGEIGSLLITGDKLDKIVNKFAIEKKIEGVNEFVERFNIEYGSGHGGALEEYSEVYCEQLRKEQEK